MLKRNIIAGLVGIIIVGGFLSILSIWLKALPLILISVGVMALALFDFYRSVRDISDARDS